MKWLIVSKEKAGQKELKEKMKKEYGWVFAASYTTKESKNTGDEEHVITKALASDIPDEEKAYITTIAAQDGMDTDEEFVTRKGMETAKACIVRPDEAYQILENMPDEDFGIIYLESESRKSKDMEEQAEDASTSLGLQPGVVD